MVTSTNRLDQGAAHGSRHTPITGTEEALFLFVAPLRGGGTARPRARPLKDDKCAYLGGQRTASSVPAPGGEAERLREGSACARIACGSRCSFTAGLSLLL